MEDFPIVEEQMSMTVVGIVDQKEQSAADWKSSPAHLKRTVKVLS